MAGDPNTQENHRSTPRRTRGLSQRLNLPEPSEPDAQQPDSLATEVLPQRNVKEPATGGHMHTRQLGATDGLLSVGTQLQSRYKILGVRGVGGMGAVYKAQDLRFRHALCCLVKVK